MKTGIKKAFINFRNVINQICYSHKINIYSYKIYAFLINIIVNILFLTVHYERIAKT